MACPSLLVAIARSYAPSDYPSPQYLEGILPFDDASFQAAAGQPYPKGMSSCAIFQMANYARAGYQFPGFGVPYKPLAGTCEGILIDFGKAQGALEANPDPRTFLAGDVFHIANGSHWGMVVEDSDGLTVQSIDGGQPGIAERIRTIGKSGSTWTMGGRPVLHVIRANKLSGPCTPTTGGWEGVGIATFFAMMVAVFTRWAIS